MPAALIIVASTAATSAGERQVHVQGGKMATRMQNGKMILTGIQGNIGGGKIHMAGRVGADAEKANSATIKFDDLSLAKAAEMIGGQPVAERLLGDVAVSGFLKGRWQGQGLKEISTGADGSLTVETGPGIITDTAVLDRLEKVTGIAHLSELKYSGIKLQARVAKGKILVDSITASGPNFKLVAKGTYNAGSDNLDMQIEASVSPEMAAKSSYMKLNNVMGFFRGESKTESTDFVDIPTLLVSGEIKKPSVTMEKSKDVAAATVAKDAKPAVADSVNRVSRFLLSQAK